MRNGKNNLVTWRCEQLDMDYVFLKLEGEFILSAGMEPNVNRAIVAHSEFAKISAAALRTPGIVEFWFNSTPQEKKTGAKSPDHTIQGVRIIDVEPVTVGTVRPDKPLPADVDPEEPIVAELRLYLADMRERISYPRGGRLFTGKINPKDLADNSNELIDNRKLVHKCVLAMGLFSAAGGNPGVFDINTIPEDLAATPALRELDWNGTPAPEELGKLLKHCRAVLCAKSKGNVRIEMLGTGAKPTIPAELAMPVVKLPGLGRRGKVVIFTSSPSPITDTVTLNGPSPATWDFVARDAHAEAKGRFSRPWTPLDKLSLFSGQTPYAALAKDLSAIDLKWRVDLREEIYRCIRLSKDYINPRISPVLHLAVGEKGELEIPEVMAKIAVREGAPDYQWKNSGDFVRCHVQFLTRDSVTGEAIFSLKELLGQVTEPTLDFTGHFLPLQAGDLQVRFSFECATKDGQKEYFRVGFRQAAGGLERVPDREIDAMIAKNDPEVVWIAAKDLKLRRIEGDDQNRQQLENQAKFMAQSYLAGSEDEYQIISAAGFVPGELSGNVNEIRWDQTGCRTTFKVNGWHYPISAPPWPATTSSGGGGRSFEGQAQTAHEKLAMGEASATQPIVPIFPTSTLPAPINAGLDIYDCFGQRIVQGAKGLQLARGLAVTATQINDAPGAKVDVSLDPGIGIAITPFSACSLIISQTPASATVDTNVFDGGSAIMQTKCSINLVTGAATGCNDSTVIPIIDCPDSVAPNNFAEAAAFGMGANGWDGW